MLITFGVPHRVARHPAKITMCVQSRSWRGCRSCYPSGAACGVAELPGLSCRCVACQWGHGARRPVRRRRYTRDTSDAEWQVIASLLPWPAWLDGRGGRPEEYCRRQVVDAIFYVADNGCKWRNLPPPARRPAEAPRPADEPVGITARAIGPLAERIGGSSTNG